MALRIVDGVPGSGKTYFAVNHLVENYIKKNKNVLVITNIEDLLIDHVSLDDLLKEKSLKEIFSDTYFKELNEKHPDKQLIVLIDECQRYFHKKFYDVDVFYFFQYHRHLGIDIYLVTQNEKLLPLQLTSLAEVLIHAQPRSTSIIGEMKYVVKVSGEAVDRQVLKPKQAVFDLYKSMQKQEGEKVKNPFKKYFIVAVLILLVSGYVFKITFLDMGKKADETKKAEKEAVPISAHQAEKSKQVDAKKDAPAPPIEKNVNVSYLKLHGEIYYVCPVDATLKPLKQCSYPFFFGSGRALPYLYFRMPEKDLPPPETSPNLTNTSPNGRIALKGPGERTSY